MRSRTRAGAAEDLSKTDRIAGVFTSHPNDVISPKEISRELDLNLQLVTTIVNRLKEEGMVERIGWGKYRLRRMVIMEDTDIRAVRDEMASLASSVFGRPFGAYCTDGGDRMTELSSLYTRIRVLGGETVASNLLLISARKHLDEDGAKKLLRTLQGREVR